MTERWGQAVAMQQVGRSFREHERRPNPIPPALADAYCAGSIPSCFISERLS
jgi:hypothetical protein